MRVSLIAVLLLATAVPAWAGCRVDGREVAFGTIEVGRRATGLGEIVIACDQAASFEVGLGGGLGSGSDRVMRGPNDGRLHYQLFRDSGRSLAWGDGGSSGGTRASRSDGNDPVRLTIYGAVPRQDSVPPGTYTDQLQVTLSF